MDKIVTIFSLYTAHCKNKKLYSLQGSCTIHYSVLKNYKDFGLKLLWLF